MKPSDRFDSLIQYWSERAQLPWDVVKRQVYAESSGNPRAESPCGARGLMQLMGPTAREVRVLEPFNPDENLRGGTEYMAKMLANVRLTVGQETITPDTLYRLALASYNCGFGYVRAALKDLLARQQPLTWENFRASLPQATVRGLKPDHKQALNYAEKILPVV